jgi:hypothetical protein
LGIESNSTPSYDKWSLGSSVFNRIASFGVGGKGSLGNGFDDDDDDDDDAVGGGDDADDDDDDADDDDSGGGDDDTDDANRTDLPFGAGSFSPRGIGGGGSL